MNNLNQTEYANGFADATGMSVEDACVQISAMTHQFNENSYDDGYKDGESFNEIFK